ncbi:MAG: hypothetical protein LBF12_05715 [Christensenellaceae bacterium]|jgi:hypothetical protein|nr:hypothetical protein [Christensenellaceae bacterium]
MILNLKRFSYIAIFLIFLITTFIVCRAVQFANAKTSTITINYVKAKTPDSTEDLVDYVYYPNTALDALQFGRDITISLSFSDPLHEGVRVEVFKNVYTNQYEEVEEKVVTIEGGNVIYNLTLSGLIKIIFTGVDEQGYSIGTNNSIDLTVRSDLTPPPEPFVDTSAFEYYSIEPVTVSFYINSDVTYINSVVTPGSGINYSRSFYSFFDTSGKPVDELTRNLTSADAQLKYINNINQNGTLWFFVYDLVGNLGTFSYSYTRHGHQNTPIPIIKLEPATTFAKEVLVDIDWGVIDDPSLIKKEYQFITPAATITRIYTEPFSVTLSTNVTIRAYYYVDGEKLYVDSEISNVDSTPPNLVGVVENAQVFCDLTATIPILMKAHIVDAKSGIKRVYAKVVYYSGYTGPLIVDLVSLPGDYYQLDLMDLTTFTLYAEDNAGNESSVVFGGMAYEYATITKYNNIFKNLETHLYSEAGLETVISAYHAVSAYINNPTVDTGYLQSLLINLDDAIKGISNISIQISDATGLEIPGVIDFEFKSDTFDMKRGDSLTVLIGTVKKSDTELANSKQEVISTFSTSNNPMVVSFAIELSKNNTTPPNVVGKYTMTIMLPSDIEAYAIYLKKENKYIAQEVLLTDDLQNLIVLADGVGEFYILGTKIEIANLGPTIFGRIFPVSTIILISVCLGVGVIGIVLLLFMLKKMRNKSKLN